MISASALKYSTLPWNQLGSVLSFIHLRKRNSLSNSKQPLGSLAGEPGSPSAKADAAQVRARCAEARGPGGHLPLWSKVHTVPFLPEQGPQPAGRHEETARVGGPSHVSRGVFPHLVSGLGRTSVEGLGGCELARHQTRPLHHSGEKPSHSLPDSEGM